MIFTFYSYKGGVGRSMALANVAKWLSMEGLRVAMVDWDLEAPGLESFFFQGGEAVQEIRSQVGLIDVLISYKRVYPRFGDRLRAAGETDRPLDAKVAVLQEALPPLLPSLHALHEMGHSVGPGGALFLFAAGCRAENRFGTYAHAVQEFDWDDFYLSYEGEAYFEWMRRQLVSPDIADVVLVDSRTGVSEMGGVCTRQLADVVLIFSAPNLQNLEGIVSMASSFIRSDLTDRRGRQASVVMVPTRVDNFNPKRINEFMREFERVTGSFTPPMFQTLQTNFWNLRIPYTPGYAYQERLAIGDPDSDKDLEEAYKRLTVHLAMLVPPETKVRRQLGTEIERIFGRLLPTVLISRTAEDRDFGQQLRERLAEANISVWPDPAESVPAGGDLRQAITGVLQQSRFLIVIATPESLQSGHVRAEWREARRLGIQVVPIAPRPLTPDVLSAVPGWMQFAAIADASKDWDRIVSIVGGPKTAARVPLMAPELPDGYVARQEPCTAAKALLLAEGPRRVAFFGLPGSGKTTVAAAVCQDDEIETLFPGGTIWVNASDDSDPKQELQKVYTAITGEQLEFADVREARLQIERRLAGSRCLFAIDDAASSDSLHAFPLEISGCGYLITTTDRAVALSANALPIEVGTLNRSETEAFVRSKRHASDAEVEEVVNAVNSVGALPITVKIASTAAQISTSSTTGPEELLANQVSPQVLKRFERQLSERFDTETSERLILLAFAAGDRALEVSAIAELWKADLASAKKTLTRLSDLSLLHVDDTRVRLHPLARYLIATSFPDRDLNKKLELSLVILPTEDQKVARQLLCRLVRFTETTGRLAFDAQTAPTKVLSQRQRALLPKLVELQFVKVTAATPDDWVAWGDETACRQWLRLQEWVQQDHDFLIWRQRLGAYIADWHRTHDPSALVAGALLSEAKRWLAERPDDLSEDETAYIKTSVKAAADGTRVTMAAVQTGSTLPPAVMAPQRRKWLMPVAASIAAIVVLVGIATVRRVGNAPAPPAGGTSSAAVPGNADTFMLQGDLSAERGELDQAIQAYTTAISMGGGNQATTYYKRGLVYSRNPDNLDKAIADFDRALAIDAERSDVLASRADARLQRGDAAGALPDFDAAIARNGDTAALYAGRAAAREAANMPAEAIEDYTKALKLDESLSGAWFRRANLYEASGDRAHAIADLRRVVALNTEPTTVRAAQARLARLGAVEAASATPSIATVYLQYQDRSDGPLVQKLSAAIAKAGFRVAAPRLVPGRTTGDVRHVPQDARAAAVVRDTTESTLADAGYDVSIGILPLSQPEAKPGRIEVWIPPLSLPTPIQQRLKK